MNRHTIAKVLAGIVILGGIVVMVGWFANIDALKSILPFWVTMKFTTALSFFLSGFVLYFAVISQEKESELGKIVLPIASLIILLLMATLLASVFLGIRTGIEDLFVKEAEGAVKTTTPGRPSSGTMIDFILIAVAGIIAMFNPTHTKKHFLWIGSVVALIGLAAIIGYVISFPLLYYTISTWSTAMAFHTAILFTLIGIGLILLGKKLEKFTTKSKTISERS